MTTTPLAESLKIVITGLRNAGKSSLLNNLLEKETAIVSATPGTTTDPITRKIELGNLGPVALTDTAGIDDVGELGDQRVEKSSKALKSADHILLATRSDKVPEQHEKELVKELKKQDKTFSFVLTHYDLGLNEKKDVWTKGAERFFVDNTKGTGIQDIRKALSSNKDMHHEMTPLEGLVKEGDTILLVTPIDLAAPKGRLILPQIETIRDGLDRDCTTIIVKERELLEAYDNLKKSPALVITDSQAFHKVAADIPATQPLTSFSILFARKKGDIGQFIEGVKALEKPTKTPKVLVLEACTHHRQADDIGTVKIPRLFRQMVAAKSEFFFSRDLSEDLCYTDFDLVIHCGACMVKRTVVMNRLAELKEAGVPVVNYGVFLAWANGLIPRALEPLGI